MPAGRPSKLTPEIQARLCELVRLGNSIETAAKAAGISEATFYNWAKRNASFRAAVDEARGQAEAILVGRIHRAAQSGSWRAACWLLERQWPEHWSTDQNKEPDGDKPKPEQPADAFAELDQLAPRREARTA